MKKGIHFFFYSLRNKKAQVLLPTVILIPVFVLLIYLLFETVKVSMTKIRNQFALDNAAYSQISATSTYLNAVAVTNGPLPYRVMRTMNTPLIPKQTYENAPPVTVFDIFYRAGAFPAIGPDHGEGAINNPPPSPQSTNWDFQYYAGTRDNWMKEDPTSAAGEDGAYVITDQEIADNYFFSATSIGLSSLKEYITTYIKLSGIYEPQDFVYKDNTKASRMFREGYFLNVKDCDKSTCAKETGQVLQRYILSTTPMNINKVKAYLSESSGYGTHSRSYPITLDLQEAISVPLFQFAYLDGGSRSKLRTMANGVRLEQGYRMPNNHFNINLTEKYKPVVRNVVVLQCPRGNNNCVWPNPLPKYGVRLAP